ncbi:hypothetical protein PHMEG_0007803 [Phytophthora megakarya]|uniref:Uncharacterized protein n=1 Tax=Phytophthora megakarya TaxID=4795 RepID=A0A225WKS0_9STRA|nr:hypothetical protein PHMEG_0007803 [Phytophthora megakarya]
MSTLVIDPASAPTSASVPASAHVSAVTPTPLSRTTVSVDKYFDLEGKKLELEAKERAGAAKPESLNTAFDGSSILATGGGIAVDYEDGELEIEGTSSSLAHEPEPASGTPRPREDNSDTSSSKRPRSESDAVPSRLEALCANLGCLDDRYGALVPPNEIPLYADNRIVDDAEAAAKRFDPTTNQRLLELEDDFWAKQSDRVAGTLLKLEPVCFELHQWSGAYRERIASERFMRLSKPFVVQRVHEGSVNANIPCAVPEGVRWCSPHHILVLCLSTTPRETLHPAVLCLQSMVDFVRLHHFRNVRHQDVSGTNLEVDPIVSNEYETNRTSVCLRTGMINDPIHLAVDRAADRVMPPVSGAGRSSYGQPRVDHGLQALHARVSQMADLRQELFLQKAYVTAAAQTTSNIRVEVLEQKVKRLEEKLRTGRASSSLMSEGSSNAYAQP